MHEHSFGVTFLWPRQSFVTSAEGACTDATFLAEPSGTVRVLVCGAPPGSTLCLAAVASGLIAASPASAAKLLRWRPGPRIDRRALSALSCPTASLCVAVDRAGSILASTMPAKRHPHWHAVYTAPGKSVTGISCPKVRLCVAIDSAGDVITSSRPGGKGTWVAAHVDSSPNYNDGSSALTGISCPSLRLCVAVDYDGNAVTSTSPTGGAAAWSVHLIDNALDYECFHHGGSGPACIPGLVAVSCASVTQCTAIDSAAGVLSSSDPTGAASWGGGQQPASESFDSLACPSARFCLLSMLYSGEVFRFSGGVLRAQANIDRSGELIGVWCQSARMCLAAGAEGFNIVTHSIFESVDPTAAHPTWKRTYRPRHGVTAVACPSAKPCLATEDNGGVLVGTT